jgi:hypothetical protein
VTGEPLEWFEDANGTGYNAAIDDLIRDLNAMRYFENAVAYLWVEGRRMELHRLRTAQSVELFERMQFIAGILRQERDRVEQSLRSLEAERSQRADQA